MRIEATPLNLEKPVSNTKKVNSNNSFGETLRNAIEEVNNLQLQAENLDRKFATGALENIHEVTIAAEKASLALELTVQIRNKVIEAYQEIMRMSV